VSGSPLENTRAAVRITQQTGQAQTPSVSPDGKELVYLSDSGGHGNLWVAKTDGSGARQITFESQLDTLVGVPAWSPRENLISFVITRSGKAGQWLIRSDGSGLRQLLERGVWSYWSGDGRWLYYTVAREGRFCIEKTPMDGGAPVVVRCDNALVPSVAPDGSALYYVSLMRQEGGAFDWEVRKASPENGPPQVLGRIPGSRIPNDFLNIQLIVSPDGRSLAVPLADGATSNLWVLPAEGGELRRVTDFGGRSVLITRRISWSPDGKYLYAAVAETDADVVLLEGLVGGK
jgi:Tol biopolymer transport system component